MKQNNELGSLLAEFVSRVLQPRGRVLAVLMQAGVTVDQSILLNYVQQQPGSTPTALAAIMSLSLPSVSQMLGRLHKQGMVRHTQDATDGRRKTIEVTARAATLLAKLQDARCEEFLVGTANLTPATRQALASAIKAALEEIAAADRRGPRQAS